MKYRFELFKQHFRESHGCDRGHEDRHFRGRGPFAAEFGDFERHFGRGRGFGRRFGGNDLRYLLLDLMAEKPRYGYEMIKEIEEQFGGNYAPSPGIVYPMLTLFEETGLATVTTEGTRKLYTITDEGRKELAENRDVADAVRSRISGAARHMGPDPQILRAMKNFGMALAMRRGTLNEEQRRRIVEIIDNAAREIERA